MDTQAFLCSPFLDYKQYASFSLTDLPLSSERQSQILTNQRMEGMPNKRRNSKETIVQPWMQPQK